MAVSLLACITVQRKALRERTEWRIKCCEDLVLSRQRGGGEKTTRARKRHHTHLIFITFAIDLSIVPLPFPPPSMSDSTNSVTASPFLPALPARPTLCTYDTTDRGKSKLTTPLTPLRSRPRETRSVAISTQSSPVLNLRIASSCGVCQTAVVSGQMI